MNVSSKWVIVILILVMLALFLLVACGDNEGTSATVQEPTHSPTPSAIPSSMPEPTSLIGEATTPAEAEALSWVYDVNYEEENTTWTVTVSSEETINGIDCYVTEITFSATPTRSSDGNSIEVKGDSIWRSRDTLDVQREDQSLLVLGTIDMTATTVYHYGDQTHGAPFESGKSWSFDKVRSVDPPMAADKTTHYTVEIVGTEEVTVPAGTFECYRIEYTEKSVDGVEVEPPKLNKAEWWAIDGQLIMPIKVENYTSYDSTETRELVSYVPSPASAPAATPVQTLTRWENGTYIDETSGFSITLPEGWTQDRERQKENDEFFHNIKNMGLVVKGIEVKVDMGCPGFFVSPDGDAYVEVRWAESPVLVKPQVAFTYSDNDFYHPGYRRIGDPMIDEETDNLTQIYTCDEGKAKEVMTVRSEPTEVWVITCMAATEAAYNKYEPTFDQILDSFQFSTTSAQGGEVEEEAGPFRITAGPYLQNVKRTGITIMWETSQPADSLVKYGLEKILTLGEELVIETEYDEQAGSEQPVKIHEVTLSGLKEGTVYHYKVTSSLPSGEVITSEDSLFRTAPDAESPITFAVYGDSRCPIDCTNWDIHERIARAIDARRPDLVFNTGDVVLSGSDRDRWIKEFLGPAGDLFKDTPFYVSIGNHEANAHWYYDFVSCPEPEDYYSFDYGNAHFIIIDCFETIDSETEWEVITPDSAEYQWLVSDLASSTAKWKFAFFHIPVYDSASNFDPSGLKLRETLAPVFEKYGVDIVFNGHDHNYERSYPMRNGQIDPDSGVIYVTTGGGGAELNWFTEKKIYYIAEGLVTHNYCIVEIAGDRFVMKVFDIDGNMIDYLTVTK